MLIYRTDTTQFLQLTVHYCVLTKHTKSYLSVSSCMARQTFLKNKGKDYAMAI